MAPFSMDALKLDAALAALLSKPAALQGGSAVDVSVRTAGELTSDQALELQALGVDGVDSRRSVFSARLSLDALRAVAAKPWILRVSLAQQLRPLEAPRMGIEPRSRSD
jgi:hypothetical protein